jgi:hypothetical protein
MYTFAAMADKKLCNGQTLGNWKLGKNLGAGGQGDVWEVRPVETPHSPPRAIKVCTATDETARKRFELEVQLLKRCTHPNIPSVLDESLKWDVHKPTELQVSFYVLERFDSSLEKLRWVHEAPLLALRFFRDLCAAVEHIHQLTPTVLHRDIKPANVMYGGEPCRIALVDFGIGHPGEGMTTPLTKTQEVVGTVRYRAPELLNGHHGDQRVDVYGLGRTLEWMLVGQEPYEVEPRAIPASSGLTPSARAQLDTVLKTACAFDPGSRFKSVAQLVESLPQLVADIAEHSGEAARLPGRRNDQSPEDAATAYETAKSLLRAEDLVGWRDVAKRQHADLSQALRQWRETREGVSGVTAETLRQWMDEVLTVLGPMLARACAAAEFGPVGIGDPVAIVRDVLGMRDWKGDGLTVLVKVPQAVAYIAHNLVGAISSSVGNTRVVIDLLKLQVVDDQGKRTTLFESHELATWPTSLGRDVQLAWDYLLALSTKHSWLANVFGSEYDYQTSVMGYWWLLSFTEFVGAARSGNLDRLVAASDKLTMRIPVVWLRNPDRMIERAFQIAFPSASAVDELCVGFDVDAQLIRVAWKQWKAILEAQVTRFVHYRFRPLDLPELPE